MERIGDLLSDLSIPISTRRGSTPSSSAQNEAKQESAAGDQGPVVLGRAGNAVPDPDEAVCPHCQGAGWLRMQVPVGDPRFGKLYPCVCRTQATEQRNMEELYQMSNLDAFASKDFLNFDPEVSETVMRAWEIARDFATHPEGWLLMLGGYGTGKTHLAAAIANYVVQRHQMQVYFAVAPDLLHQLRSTYAPTSNITYDERFEQIRSVYLLVIDDLGSEQTTPWAAEKLYQIFNFRYNNRLPTVITSNSDLDSLDPRIRSRLCDPDLCCHVFMDGADYRMRRMDPRFVSRGQGRPAQEKQRNYSKGQGR